MAKLKAPLYAGFNAGKSYYASTMKIDSIVIDPEISNIFKINQNIVEEIKQMIVIHGFDESQPLVIQKGTNILLDGHTRLMAAKLAGLSEVPVVIREFEDREDAVMYTFERQALRRNLTGAEILTAAQMIHGRKEKDGKGRAAELLAKRLNVGVATIYQAKAILEKSTEEDIKAVQNGDASIKKTYNKLCKQKKEEKPDYTQDLSVDIMFLKEAVILLSEKNNHQSAIELLIKHFLKKNEIASFIKLLPENIQNSFATLV